MYTSIRLQVGMGIGIKKFWFPCGNRKHVFFTPVGTLAWPSRQSFHYRHWAVNIVESVRQDTIEFWQNKFKIRRSKRRFERFISQRLAHVRHCINMLMTRLETTSRIWIKFVPSFEESTSKTVNTHLHTPKWWLVSEHYWLGSSSRRRQGVVSCPCHAIDIGISPLVSSARDRTCQERLLRVRHTSHGVNLSRIPGRSLWKLGRVSRQSLRHIPSYFEAKSNTTRSNGGRPAFHRNPSSYPDSTRRHVLLSMSNVVCSLRVYDGAVSIQTPNASMSQNLRSWWLTSSSGSNTYTYRIRFPGPLVVVETGLAITKPNDVNSAYGSECSPRLTSTGAIKAATSRPSKTSTVPSPNDSTGTSRKCA